MEEFTVNVITLFDLFISQSLHKTFRSDIEELLSTHGVKHSGKAPEAIVMSQFFELALHLSLEGCCLTTRAAWCL